MVNFFQCLTALLGNRLLKEVMESPSPEGFKRHADVTLEDTL